MAATNKLIIYLIKDKFKDGHNIVKKANKHFTFRGIGTFYTSDSFSKEPDWLQDFFKGRIGNVALFSASAKGILLTNVTFKRKKISFAVSFGGGRHFLNEEAIEEGFGLKVTLNTVEKDSIRSIEKSNIGANSKLSKEQMSKSTNASEFGIDIEQDLVRAVTGKSRLAQFGQTIAGADALSVSVKVDIDTIKEFLVHVYARYLSKDYLTEFDWIDQIKHIKNPTIMENLEAILLQRYNNQDFDKLWMAVPDLLDWSELKGFKYIPRKEELSDDLDIQEFREAVGEIDHLDKLISRRVHAISAISDTDIAHWNVFRCLYGEIELRKKQYVINNGKWYEIEKDFVKLVNRLYSKIPLSKVSLPDYDHDNEGDYNIAAAGSNVAYLLMDKRTIMHGGSRNKIEFCDIYSKDKKMIHVKHYGASAVLSHLFQQGMNAGEYLNSDSEFRRKLNNELSAGWKFKNPDRGINPESFEIIFAIISRKGNKRPSIPFFSKVSIKNVTRRLKGYRYKVSLKKITSLRS